MVDVNVKICNENEINIPINFLNASFSDSKNNFFFKKHSIINKIFKNPYEKGYFVYVEDDDRNIYGCASITPKNLFYKGKKILLAEIGDTFSVQSMSYIKKFGLKKINFCKDHKLNCYDAEQIKFINRSIFGRLVDYLLYIAKQNNFELIYGTCNNQSLSSYINRFKFKKVENQEVYDLYLINTKLIEIRFKVIKNLNFIFNNLFRLYYKLFLCNIFINKKKFILQEITKFKMHTQILNNLWNESSGKELSLIKDAKYLEWRFKSIEYRKFIFYKDKKAVAWIIIKKNKKDNYEKITICDLLFSCSNKEFKYFLFCVLNKFDYLNSIINIWDNSNKNIFNNYLFIKKQKINLIYKNLNISNDHDAINYVNNFTIGCSDNI
jgi:hypothetical protein